MRISDSMLDIQNTVFDGNISDESTGIEVYLSQITMKNNVFSNQICQFCCYLRIYSKSTVHDENSILRDAYAY